jgi:hypothetical protein
LTTDGTITCWGDNPLAGLRRRRHEDVRLAKDTAVPSRAGHGWTCVVSKHISIPTRDILRSDVRLVQEFLAQG